MTTIENITPPRNRVICVYPDPETMSKGGIILPENRDKPSIMDVVKVSDQLGEKISPGDRVIFNGYSGSTFRLDGKEYLSLKEEDIFGVITKE
jgi:chaperonin GroES